MKYRELIKNLVITDLKLKYKNTVLGFIWSLLNPFLMMLILWFVFSRILRFGVENYAVFLLLGIVLWRFFANGTTAGMHTIVNNLSLIRKVYFPREILVLSSAISSLITALLESVVFFLIFLSITKHIYPVSLLLLIIIFFEFLLVLGLGFLLSCGFGFYRDLNHIWEIILQAGFFATPIFYPLTLIPKRFLTYYLLNPMARIIEGGHSLVLSGKIPVATDFLILFGISLFFLALGYFIFKHNESRFAKEI
ncbi:ABC transporter permease [candidate division WOR-3 bacterium]|nr:ABC transporter permease [candidate division WOR-3 bacterium]